MEAHRTSLVWPLIVTCALAAPVTVLNLVDRANHREVAQLRAQARCEGHAVRARASEIERQLDQLGDQLTDALDRVQEAQDQADLDAANRALAALREKHATLATEMATLNSAP